LRYGMVISLSRCIGCNACSIACKHENGTGPGVFWRKVIITESGKYPQAAMHALPLLCNHCEDPSCAKVCPVKATKMDANGMVTIDAKKCIGCRYCMTACPYNVRAYVRSNDKGYFDEGLTEYEKAVYGEHKVGTVEKCTFCAQRVEEGKNPACVQTCPAKALFFGDLDDPASQVAKLLTDNPNAKTLKPEAGTKPKVFYI